MEEDEDTYGFGSFSDLFDAGTTQTTKRLNLSALSRYCMSERLFSRFQQRRKDKRCVLFQHVAAKFNGVGIDGGLGELGVAETEGGGFVWLQTTKSDSDALERRRKELQDITRQESREHKSAEALFVGIKCVVNVHPTTVQNTVQGVEVKLAEGDKLEFTFMPGPFASPKYRDEFIQRLQKQMRAEKEMNQAGDGTERTNSDAMSELKRKTPDLELSTGKSAYVKKEEFRQLVRKYMSLNQMSEEAIVIAKQVYAETGYQLGPMTKDVLKFSEDSEYRKKTVEKLTDFLKRMNQEWSKADKHREMHTKTKHSRNEDDLFEYTDTVTGARISTRTYEQRYLEYVKAHEVDPVLRMFPVQNGAAKAGQHEQNGTSTQPRASAGPDIGAHFMKTLGIDITSSCIIDKNFFSPVAANVPTTSSVYRAEDKAFRAAVDKTRVELWNSWGSWFAGESGGLDHTKRRTQSASGVSATRKRSKDRRRSLVLPSSEDLQSTVEASINKKSQEANGSTSISEPRTKRSRSSAHEAQESRRKARRQSITGVVNLPSVVPTKADGKVTEKRKTPQRTRISPGPRRETSSLEMVGDEDSNLCQLCFNDQALVHMKPCNHTVCTSCWTRLPPSSRKNGTDSGRVCPWDREVVMKR
ncbi:hypothetical protein P3T76_003187 [Phytophthora citrophthora]|uniref:RING-type domain-containing protein n=1 Tax=Phytophthora citrophthora TaxID=4793 RepID=A0AAD9GVY4_9STRA|nr:hypothetical protein P3T76_003187 [Phytophthora citrophthora]